MDRMLEARTAEMEAHDSLSWEAWQHLPMECWPDAALISFLIGTVWESAFDGVQPSAAEVRAIVAEAIGPCHVVPTKKEQRQ
jgi:hypothetical protein